MTKFEEKKIRARLATQGTEINSVKADTTNLQTLSTYEKFYKIVDPIVTLLDGGVKVDNYTIRVPAGQKGYMSYIGADLYLDQKLLVNKNKIRLYVYVTITTPSTALDYKDIKLQMFTPNGAAFTEVTQPTNVITEGNTVILYSDYQLTGNEGYIKVRASNRCATAVSADTTIKAVGWCYNILKTNSTTNIENRELLFDGTYNGTVTPVVKNIVGDVIVDITKGRNCTLKVYGVSGNNKYQLPLTNLVSGTTTKEAVYSSRYKVHSDGYTTFSFELYGSGDSGIFQAYIIPRSNETPLQVMGDYKNKIVTTAISNSVSTVAGVAIWGVRDGKMIGTKIVSNVVNLVESDTNFANFTRVSDIPNTTVHPSHVEVLDNNAVIIICKNNGKVLKTTNLTTFTEVLDIGDRIYEWGHFTQLDAYENIVLVSEYRLPVQYNTAGDTAGRRLFLSTDRGDNFTVALDLSTQMTSVMNCHIHACKYDPYEKIIWVVTGDGLARQMIWYSLDMGTTWFKSTDDAGNAVQMTSIIPLKNCVLFGSDARLVGVGRYNRPKCGTLAGAKLNLDYPFIVHEGWGIVGSTNVPVASRPCIDYTNSKAYFSWLGAPYIHTENTTDKFKYAQVYCTDGYTFYEVFKHNATVDYGVPAVYSNLSNNQVIGKMGLEGAFVKISTNNLWAKD